MKLYLALDALNLRLMQIFARNGANGGKSGLFPVSPAARRLNNKPFTFFNLNFTNATKSMLFSMLVDEKRLKQAEKQLKLNERQFCRLLNQYQQFGAADLISTHRNKPGNHGFSEYFKQQVMKQVS